MTRRAILWILLCLMVMVSSLGSALAQTSDIAEPELNADYRRFKFYDEEEEWWAPQADSIALEDIAHGLGLEFTRNILISLATHNIEYRGAGYEEEQHRAGGLSIDYSTARLLSQLGIGSESLSGLGAHLTAAGVEATHYHIFDQPRYRGHRLNAAFSGRNYLFSVSHRATYKPESQGIRLRDGLTIAHFERVRMGRDLYVDGVYTEAMDLGVDVMYVNRRHSMRVVALLPWSERGLRRSSTYEAYDLLGNTMYNSLWGIYRGKMRNSGVRATFRPEVLASWRYSLTLNTELLLSLNVGYERTSRTSLAWFDAPTPMPDNYRYMPSFFNNAEDASSATAAWTTNDLRYTQVDWAGLYLTNAVQGDGHARYAVDAYRTNRPFAHLAAGIRSRIGSVDVECGVEFNVDSRRMFKQMEDLLGASHVLNIDYNLRDDTSFGTKLDNDLGNPGRVVAEGERYDHDYRLTRMDAALYATAEWRVGRMTFGLGTRLAAELSWRRGYVEKELFAGRSSYGRSAMIANSPAHLVARWHYNLGEHDLSAALLLRGRSADIDDMFLQPKYNNRTVGLTTLEKMYGMELSYGYSRQRFSLVASLYANWTMDGSRVERYYDDMMGLYADTLIEGIDHLNLGLEVTAHVDWMRYLSSTLYLSVGRYRYTSNPEVTLYADRDNSVVAYSHSMMRGCRVGAPEVVAYGDISFRPAGGWLATLAVKYWGGRVVEPSFVRRSGHIVSHAASAEGRETLLSQQRLKGATMVDVAVAKSFRVGLNRNYLRVSLSVRNLLSVRSVYRGYEQNRVRRLPADGYNLLRPFDNQLLYDYPRTIYLSVVFSF